MSEADRVIKNLERLGGDYAEARIKEIRRRQLHLCVPWRRQPEIVIEDPNGIEVPERLREIRGGWKVSLAESMKIHGLQNPISIWYPSDDRCELVAGAHRLAAAVHLGWTEIPCVVLDGWSELDRQLWEIDENFIRADLSVEERDQHLARRKKLWEARREQRQEESGARCATLPTGRGNKGFAAETSEITGLSKSAINRAVARAEAARDPDHVPKPKAQHQQPRDDDKVLSEFYRWWNKATDRQRRLAIHWATETDRPGEPPIGEIVEGLRSALRGGRVEAREKGFVAGILSRSKTGRWWPTPAEEYRARNLHAELTEPPLIESIIEDQQQ